MPSSEEPDVAVQEPQQQISESAPEPPPATSAFLTGVEGEGEDEEREPAAAEEPAEAAVASKATSSSLKARLEDAALARAAAMALLKKADNFFHYHTRATGWEMWLEACREHRSATQRHEALTQRSTLCLLHHEYTRAWRAWSARVSERNEHVQQLRGAMAQMESLFLRAMWRTWKESYDERVQWREQLARGWQQVMRRKELQQLSEAVKQWRARLQAWTDGLAEVRRSSAPTQCIPSPSHPLTLTSSPYPLSILSPLSLPTLTLCPSLSLPCPPTGAPRASLLPESHPAPRILLVGSGVEAAEPNTELYLPRDGSRREEEEAEGVGRDRRPRYRKAGV